MTDDTAGAEPSRDATVFPVCRCGGEIATMREMAELPPSEDRWCMCLDPGPAKARRRCANVDALGQRCVLTPRHRGRHQRVPIPAAANPQEDETDAR